MTTIDNNQVSALDKEICRQSDEATGETATDLSTNPQTDLTINPQDDSLIYLQSNLPHPAAMTDREIAEETLTRLRNMDSLFGKAFGQLSTMMSGGASPLSLLLGRKNKG